jgi:hypothetical protein
MKSELPLDIEAADGWTVSPPRDLSEFLRHLPSLVPNDSILCLEGVIDSEIETFLKQRPAKYENETKQGFLKLRSKIFYMPVTEENLHRFALLSENFAAPEICGHLRVYHNDKVILSWYDLPHDPLNLANDIDKTALEKFCEILDCSYAKQVEII